MSVSASHSLMQFISHKVHVNAAPVIHTVCVTLLRYVGNSKAFAAVLYARARCLCVVRSQTVKPLYFLTLCYLKAVHCKVSGTFSTPLLKASVFFSVVAKFDSRLLSSANRSTCTCPVKLLSFVCSPRTAFCSVFLVSSQTVCQRSKR